MRKSRRSTLLFTVSVAIVAVILLAISLNSSTAGAATAVRAGFNASTLPANDDGSTGLVPMGFTANFLGANYNSLYVNNNGNVTFDLPLGTYTPFDLTSTARVIIAPFFADVDTRIGAVVTYGTGTVGGRPAFGVNWPLVGCFSMITTVQNDFQVLLIDRSDVAAGDFDIEFNYDSIEWETGQASGGDTSCQGGASARVGYSNGTGAPGTFFELPGSAINGAFLDSNISTGLANNRRNSSTVGRYVFPVRGGVTTGSDDVISSLGKFRILVAEQFRDLMAGYPGYDGVSRLDSPTLSDPSTVVGRSVYHLDGDATDTLGAIVGTAGTLISDSDFSLVPDGFEGPAGSREIHTEIRELNLTLGSIAVRAGINAPDQPMSPGEVESQSASGNPVDDFPADSFFNVFVEVDLPAAFAFPGGTLYNSDPLLVVNTNVTSLPPRVVYKHGNSSAVPLFFKSDNLPEWQAGDLFGWLVLAGHGASFEDTPEDRGEFEDIVTTFPELPTPTPPAKLPYPGDTDGDGCPDVNENLAKSEVANGGGRDWQNPWDWYDVNQDGVIDLVIDILGVIDHWAPLAGGLPPYDVIFDRGPSAGPNFWNMTAPDGIIDLTTDILGVIDQWSPLGCT